jgi:hypothetical protein
MAHAVRLDKYKDFNPEAGKWRHDKRNYDQATQALEIQVAKNFSKLALPCAAIYPEMKNGNFAGFKVAAPDGPLKEYFAQDDTKKILFNLIQDACIDAIAKKEEVRKGNEVIANATVVKAIAFKEPPRPVWILNLKELESYFSGLKTQLALEDGIKIRRKWPKLVNGKATELPTVVPGLDDVCEMLLPSEAFIPAQKFLPGNVHWRLKLVCAYIMLKYGKNPDKFAGEIPADYKPRSFKIKDLKEFGNNVEQSANKHKQRKKKKVEENRGYVPFYEDESDHFDYDASDSDELDASSAEYRPAVEDSDDIETIRPSVIKDIQATQPLKRARSPSPTPGTSGSSRTLPYSLGDRRQKKKKPTSLFEGMVPVSVSVPAPKDLFLDAHELELDISRTTGTPEGSVDGDDDNEKSRKS